ncbi:hemerythrin domain-containing protein [Streptomyces longisporus]|uniref:Hemerythrin domain-containing protein n=1 Tax=Streptomyces longisporus TaxID=1948 RepID=A0ABP5Y5V7_STRLO
MLQPSRKHHSAPPKDAAATHRAWLMLALATTGDAQRDGKIAYMAELAREISAVLGPHTQVEEYGLFPALAADFPEKIAALEDEHRRVEAALAEANGPYLADPAWPNRLIETLDLLREHILKEQDGVFPAALALLDTEQWETVEAVRAQAGTGMSESMPLT